MATPQNPSDGYTTFDGSISDLLTKRTKWGTALTAINAQKTAIANAWTAEGSTVLQANVQAVADTIPEVRETLLNAHTALQAYKNELVSIHAAQQTWITQRDNADWQLNQPDRSVLVDPVGAAQDSADRIVNWTRYEEARMQLQWLYDNRRSPADNALIAALAAAMPASWADTSAAFQAAGITQATLRSSTDSQQVMLDIAQRMLDGDMSDENIAALSALLSVWGNNQTTMSTFFQNLGGANAAELIDRLGEEMSMVAGSYGELDDRDQAILTLANRLRSGLSVGSENWTQEYANEYVRDMMTGNPDYWEHRADQGGSDPSSYSAMAQAVSFLFSDPTGAPMSDTMAYAAALMVDELENGTGNTTLVNYVNPQAGIGAGVFGFYTADGVYTGEMSQMDLPGRVFETLGLYPDLALEFLTGDDDRISYWFGERDWSYADGFAGPGALWLGAAQVDGAESTQVASEIMWNLFGNESFLSENVTDEGSIYLAGAVGMDLGALSEYVASHSGDLITGPGSGTVELFGEGSTIDSPIVNTEVLAKILGVVGGHDGGSILLQEHATALQDAYFAYGLTHPESFEGAMRQADLLQAAIDGSGIGERVAAAERSDQAREDMIEGISTLIGFVPIPGASGLIVEGGIKLLDYTQDLIISLGSDAITNAIIGSHSDYALAISQMGLDQTELAARMDTINGMNVYALLQSPDAQSALAEQGISTASLVLPTQGADQSAESFTNEMQNWVATHREDLDEAAQVVLGNPEFSLNDAHVDYENGSGNYAKLVNLV